MTIEKTRINTFKQSVLDLTMDVKQWNLLWVTVDRPYKLTYQLINQLFLKGTGELKMYYFGGQQVDLKKYKLGSKCNVIRI